MNNFLKLLLGTGIYLLEQSDRTSKTLRERAAHNFGDAREYAQEKYEVAADRVGRASRAIRGEDNAFLANTVSLAAGLGIGIGIGLLFAPASGSQTRSAIADKVQGFGDQVKRRFSSEEVFATGTNG